MPLKFPYDVFLSDNKGVPKDKQTKGFPKTLFDMVNEGDIVEENDKPIQWNVAQKSNGYMLLVNPNDQLKSKGVTKSDFNQNYHVALEQITNTGEDVSWQSQKPIDATAKIAAIVDPEIEELLHRDWGGTHYNEKMGRKALTKLKPMLSPEGWEVVKKFMKGATGWNRWHIIDRYLPQWVQPGVKVSKSWLRSYANTDLMKLIDTGDISLKGEEPNEEDNKFFEQKMRDSFSKKLAELDEKYKEPVKIPKGAPVEDKNLNKPQFEGMAKKKGMSNFQPAILEKMGFILDNIMNAYPVEGDKKNSSIIEGAKMFYRVLAKWIEKPNL